VKLRERPATLREADALVANSAFTAGVLQRAGYRQVHAIPNGVDTGLFRSVPWRGDRKAVLYPVARSRQERKGHSHFVEMARAVRAKRPDVRFRILNDPGDSLCEGVPYLTRAELAQEFSDDYLAVVPSLWDEPFGLVTVEAMAAGRPVVAYRGGAMAEIIEDGVTGRLVPRGDIEELTRTVLELLDDEDRARRMGVAARERAERLFDYRTMAHQYLALVNQLVEGRRAELRAT
jgi:glycosyltransferase involved in cell wall biosynthesis